MTDEHNKSPEQELEKRNHLLLEAQMRNAELERKNSRLERDLNDSIWHLDLLRSDIRALFGSITWRFGAFAAELVRRLTFRPQEPLARDHIDMVLASYDRMRARQSSTEVEALPELNYSDLAHRTLSCNSGYLMDYAAPATKRLRVGVAVQNETTAGSAAGKQLRLMPLLLHARVRARVQIIELRELDTWPSQLDLVLMTDSFLGSLIQAQHLLQRTREHFIPLWMDAGNTLNESADGAVQRFLMTHCDLLTCPTDALANELSQLSPAVVVSDPIELAAAGPEAPDALLTQADDLNAAAALSVLRRLHDVVTRHQQAREIRTLPFVESSYLSQNPDVEHGIRNGTLESGLRHWTTIGADECCSGVRSYHPYQAPVSLGLRVQDTEDMARAKREVELTAARWSTQPLISIVMPVYNVEERWLDSAIESVKAQLYEHWELCICDDASSTLDTKTIIETADDRRIKLVRNDTNLGIAAATNSALALATGSHVTFMDHDDELSGDALFQVARVIVEDDPDFIYSDEAKLELDGTIVEPHFKPDFSRELIQSQNYISHLSVFRRAEVVALGGIRLGVDGSQDHDLVLRYLKQSNSIAHISRALYFWRKIPESTAAEFSVKNYAWDAGQAALEHHHGISSGISVEKGPYPGTYRVRRPIEGEPLVSVIIPFRDEPELLEQCLQSITNNTDYPAFEIIGIDNQSELDATHDMMSKWASKDARIRFVPHPHPFNYSAINNMGFEHTKGEHVLLLNNDTTVIEPGWMTALLEFSQLPDVGAVGGLLCYPDDTIQHAGVVIGIGGVAGHSHKYQPLIHHGYFSRPHLIHNVSAVTGACMMVKRDLFELAGGLNDEDLQVAFNDIDFCLRLRELGYENVYTPYCKLYHHESKSRGSEDTFEKQKRFQAEALYMKRRHALALASGDPYYNANLTLDHENFRMRS